MDLSTAITFSELTTTGMTCGMKKWNIVIWFPVWVSHILLFSTGTLYWYNLQAYSLFQVVKNASAGHHSSTATMKTSKKILYSFKGSFREGFVITNLDVFFY